MLLVKVNAIHEEVLSRTYLHSLRVNLSVELSFFFRSMHYLIVKVISIFSFSIRSSQKRRDLIPYNLGYPSQENLALPYPTKF